VRMRKNSSTPRRWRTSSLRSTKSPRFEKALKTAYDLRCALDKTFCRGV
jgi:hypothetical protein